MLYEFYEGSVDSTAWFRSLSYQEFLVFIVKLADLSVKEELEIAEKVKKILIILTKAHLNQTLAFE
jgi:hypothetical protein